MVTVTLAGKQYQLGDSAVQKLHEKQEREFLKLISLEYEIARVYDMESLRQLQKRIAQARIDELLSASHPDFRHLGMLESWTHVLEVGPLPRR